MYRRRNMREYSLKGNLISIIIVIFFILGGVIFGAYMNDSNNYEKTSLSKEEFLNVVDNTDRILIMKEYFSLSNKYYIIVDNKIVGTVEGEILKFFGDCFTMRSSNGDLIFYENEEIMHLNNQASIKDEDGVEAGRIESEIFSLLYKCYYYDKEGNLKATSNQKFSLLRKDTILDNEGNVSYEINDTNIFASNLYIETKNESDISPVAAIFIATINEAIDSSSN